MNGLGVEGSCPDLFLRHHANNQVGVAKKRTANGALRDVVQTLYPGVLYPQNSINYKCQHNLITNLTSWIRASRY